MLADANLSPVTPATDPTLAAGPLAPLDHVRHQVAAALFGDPVPVRALGRFQIQRLVGAGGMGVVHAATDPELGRTVAVKLLHPATSDPRARDRLLREAQAMARLQHPNVVGVLEVGAFADQVYIVMEYVDGGTLGDWLRAAPRTWQSVVQVLAQAGDGLAAAHAAGLVHRDFKPANILMGGGRPRISDFGLARTDEDAADLERTAGDDPLLLASPLTRTGALLGTPAYMAPEQLRGDTATALSDQFAFAVVAYEALSGHRPFPGDSVPALLAAAERGQILAPQRRLPGSLLAVLRRALAGDPARRYPDMPALLAALRGVRDYRSRLLAVAASAGLALTGLVTLAHFSNPGAPGAPGAPTGAPGSPGAPSVAPPLADLAAMRCDADPLAGIYDADRRFHVAAALSSETDGTLTALDAYAADWRAAHRRHCDARAPGETAGWTETCLADRRTALADLAHALLTTSPKRRANAPAAARELLPALADCAAPVRYLALASEDPRDVRAEAWQLRLDLAPAFLPRAATRAQDFNLGMSGTGLGLAFSKHLRLKHELGLAAAVAELAAKPPAERHATYKTLANVAVTADNDGVVDLAARAWALAAEVLESGPHSEADHARTREAAVTALTQLPADHPLSTRLRRDLAVVELAHGRHTTAPGACHLGEASLATCRPVFSAISDLQTVIKDPAAGPADRELLARALDHAGQTALAAALHDQGDRTLDEKTLGYLEFSSVVVPDAPAFDNRIRCLGDASRCEVDRPLADAWNADLGLLLSQARMMPSVKDGVPRGVKLYGSRPGNAFDLLGFKNGDLIVAIDGRPVPGLDEFTKAFTALLTRGDGSLQVERKGLSATRHLVVR